MKRLAFAVVLALGVVAATPAEADYAIAKFRSGYCRIWDHTAVPLTGFTPTSDQRCQAIHLTL